MITVHLNMAAITTDGTRVIQMQSTTPRLICGVYVIIIQTDITAIVYYLNVFCGI